MYKKIIAGVAAVLMAATSVPLAEIAQVIPDFGITASASSSVTTNVPESSKDDHVTVGSFNGNTLTGTLKIETGRTDDDGNALPTKVTITPDSALLKSTNATYTIDMSAAKEQFPSVDKNGNSIDYTNAEVVLSAKFSHSDNVNLAAVKFTDNLITTVGDSMFNGCKNLSRVDFSGSAVTKLGNSVFSSCTAFTGNGSNTIDLTNIVEIGSSCFSGCTSLKGVKFDSNTTKIGSSAFNNTGINTAVTIPKTVEEIGSGAFSNVKALEKVVFENGCAPILNDSIFSSCTSLKEVHANGKNNKTDMNTLPDGSKYYDSTLKVTIPGTGKSIFQNCESLQNFSVPNAFTFINSYMFQNCTNLNNIKFDRTNSQCTIIGESAFSKCTSIGEVRLPDNTTVLGNNAFINCGDGLKKIVVSDNTVSFGGACFAGNWRMKLSDYSDENSLKDNQIIIPPLVEVVPEKCFQNDSGITSVKLHENVSVIEKNAFEGCKALPDITIPDAVTIINESTFKNCEKLADVYYSRNLTTIMNDAFYGCTALSTFTPNGTAKQNYTIKFGATVAGVQKQAFKDCKTFKYINFLTSSGKTEFSTVAESAFEGCEKFKGSSSNGTSSSTIEMPEGVTIIQKNAFKNCKELDSIIFKGEVTQLQESAFYGCEKLATIKLNSQLSELGKSAFEKCTSLKEVPVTAMANLDVLNERVFSNCDSLKSVKITKNITEIKDYAFQDCDNLATLTFENGSKTDTIGNYAFQNCKKLATITAEGNAVYNFPNSIKSIGNNAFNQTGIKSLRMNKPSSDITLIGQNAFSKCENLTSVDLSDTNIEILSSSIFSDDENLKTVKLPNTVTTMNDSAFANCKTLSTINSTEKGTYNLPVNLDTINNYVFKNNHCMAKIVIPAATTLIKLSAFDFNFTYTQDDIKSGKINPLKAFVVDAKNQNYKSVDGVLFSKDGKTLIFYPEFKAGTKYTVPSSVETLSESCFSSNDLLVQVVMGANVKNIEKNAFNKCGSLRSIAFLNNKNVVIDNNAFSNLKNDLIFYAAKGSTAETHAKTNSRITFIDNNTETKSISIKQGRSMSVSLKGSRYLQLDAVLKTASGALTVDDLKWTTSNDEIATVNDEGYVTFRGKSGVVTITATTASGLSASIKITAEDRIYLSNCTVELAKTTAVYTGKARTMGSAITVKNGSSELKNGKDYKISYKNNVNVGTATVVITGLGDCKGTLTRTFKIVPATPKVKTAASGAASIKLSWSKAAGAKGYVVYKSVGGKWKKVGSTSSTSYTAKGLKSGTAYKFAVKAYNGNYSGSLATVTTATVTSKVSTPSVKRTGLSLAKASWKKVSGANGYQLNVATNKSMKGGKVVTVKGTSANFKASVGKTYYVRVRTYKVVGGKKYYSAWSSLKKVSAVKKPAKTAVSVKSTSKKTVKISWKKVSSAQGYQVQYSQNKNFKGAKTLTSGKTTSKTVKLSSKKKYYVRVRAYKKVGSKKYVGSWSKVKAVRVK